MLPSETRDVAALLSSIEAGHRAEFLFFWGHRPKAPGEVGPWVLSQWFPSSFEHEGCSYRTAEHWMMAEKARLFQDPEFLEQILASESPAEAKKLGRQVRGFEAEVWETERFSAVVRGNVLKFRAHPEFAAYLASTAGRVLVEASPRDRIWGVGLGARRAAELGPSGWRGRNLLGFALMEVRDQLVG